MRKLTLNLDDLQVDSFTPAEGQVPHNGTVRGYFTNPCDVNPIPNTARKTEPVTCPYTCDDGTCVGSCQGTSCYLPACNTCESCPGGPCHVDETDACTA